jgi:dsRNA-specific ribonuclease
MSREFLEFIESFLERTRLEQRYTHILLEPSSIFYFKQAFTHSSISEECNYEFFEQLGDIMVNKFLVWYFHRRFTQLHTALGVKVIARLRIKYGSKNFLFSLAEKYGFWNYIQATDEVKEADRRSLLEDVFEAVFGVIEYLIDERLHRGLGYICCYNLLQSIYDPIPIDISYEALFDAKTRLKETFDLFRDLGQLKFDLERSEKGGCTVHVQRITEDGQTIPICFASGDIKTLAEQNASEKAITILRNQGFYKQIPNLYKSLE